MEKVRSTWENQNHSKCLFLVNSINEYSFTNVSSATVTVTQLKTSYQLQSNALMLLTKLMKPIHTYSVKQLFILQFTYLLQCTWLGDQLPLIASLMAHTYSHGLIRKLMQWSLVESYQSHSMTAFMVNSSHVLVQISQLWLTLNASSLSSMVYI